MPRLPGHRYLGPGNSVRSGQPVDRDDEIAEIHDLAYEIQPDNVESADRAAEDSFLEDFSTSGNVHSLIGGIGLQAKRSYEGIFGQQYPMSGKSHGGRSDYQYATKRLSEIYREQKRSGQNIGSWREFQKLHFGELMRESRQKRGHGQSDSGGGEANSKRPRDDAVAGPSGISQRGNQSPEYSPLHDSDWDDMLRNLDEQPVGDGGAVQSMESIANPSKGGGVSGHSHRGSGSGQLVNIPVTPRTSYYTKTYRKNWVFFGYGFANTKIVVNNNNYYTTPLLLIPVDMLAMYMDAAEFALLAGRAVAVHCRARVRPLGCRMNFQTAATESRWATSEFVAIGQSAIGLNKQMPGENVKITPEAAKPMIPSTITPINTDDLHEKLYGDEEGRGAAQMVPRHLNIYYAPIQAQPNAGQVRRFTHNQGPPKVDQFINRFLVNTAIGEPIINYEYTIKNGIIGDTYSADYINRETLFRTASRATQLEVNPFMTDRGLLVEGVTTQQTQENPHDINLWRSAFVANLYQTLEHYQSYKWDKGHIHGNVQPQVHVGLTAVPAINPGSEATDFQNTSIYWAVETELVVHHYQNSCFHEGQLHTYAPYFYPPDYIKKYHSGNTYNGHANLHDNQWQADTRRDIPPEQIKTSYHHHDYVMENMVGDDASSIEMLPAVNSSDQHGTTTDTDGANKSTVATRVAKYLDGRGASKFPTAK